MMNKNLPCFLCLLFVLICSGVYCQNTDYTVFPDTLFFVEPDDFVFGKEFTICNTQPDTLYIQHMDQFGFMNCYCAPWYVDPYIPSFPLLLGPDDSLTSTVRFAAIDSPYSGGMVYDSLFIISAGDTNWIILTADSIYIWVGNEEPDNMRTGVFPNPFLDEVTVSIIVTRSLPVSLRIYNTNTQTVKTMKQKILSPGENRIIWNGTDDLHNPVPAGLYFFEIRTSKDVKILKILKN